MSHHHHEHIFRFANHQPHPAAVRAFEIHQQRATAMGQVWSEKHAEAFRELHQAYVLTSLGMHRGRTAWPLAVGTGKTQSLVAFALAQSEQCSPLSLLVCIERVDQGRDLYKAMLGAGVPEHMVAVYHRKTPAEVKAEGLQPSVAEGDIGKYPFLIATHAMMLKGEDFIAKVNTYQGAERRLVVWDESLIKSQGQNLDLAMTEAAVSVLQLTVRDTSGETYRDAKDAAGYLASCTELLRTEFERVSAGAVPQTVVLPTVTPSDDLRFHNGILAALRGKSGIHTDAARQLRKFLEHAQMPVRVVPYVDRGRRVGVIHYKERIPESLKRLIVLDASHVIRRLTSEHDATLRQTLVDCKVKSFHTGVSGFLCLRRF